MRFEIEESVCAGFHVARGAAGIGGKRGRYALFWEIFLFEPQGDVDKADEHRHLDERADDRREGDARTDAEDRDGHGDGEFEVVARCGEGECGGAAVVRTEFSAHEETHQEHDGEINGERDGDAHDIERQFDDFLALECEHHDDGEEQRREGDRRDFRDEHMDWVSP